MSGLPEHNYPAFHAAENLLTAAGYDPINPARDEGRENARTWADYMRAALHDVAEADAIALLDGWENSRGARLEHTIAAALAMPAHPLRCWTTTSTRRSR